MYLLESFHLISAIALGIGLSACCGFRVFIPMLVAALAIRLHWITVNAGMEWLATMPALIAIGSAVIFEVSAYYIPFVDNLLDSLAIPLSVAAGTVLAASVLPVGDLNPLLKWGLGLLAGGATAGTINTGTSLLRLFSSKATAGFGNGAIATVENLAALTGSLASLVLPVLTALFLLFFSIYLGLRLMRKMLPSGDTSQDYQ